MELDNSTLSYEYRRVLDGELAQVCLYVCACVCHVCFCVCVYLMYLVTWL